MFWQFILYEPIPRWLEWLVAGGVGAGGALIGGLFTMWATSRAHKRGAKKELGLELIGSAGEVFRAVVDLAEYRNGEMDIGFQNKAEAAIWNAYLVSLRATPVMIVKTLEVFEVFRMFALSVVFETTEEGYGGYRPEPPNRKEINELYSKLLHFVMTLGDELKLKKAIKFHFFLKGREPKT